MKITLFTIAFAALGACSVGAGNSGAPVVVTPTPAAPEPTVVIALGQSNMIGRGFGGNMVIPENLSIIDNSGEPVVGATIERTFSRLLADATPDQQVVLLKVAASGQRVGGWEAGGPQRIQLEREWLEAGLPPADFLLIHQGEANYMDGPEWAARWNVVLQDLHDLGIIDDETIILFGELAQGTFADAQNGNMTLLNADAIVSSDGLDLRDMLHFTGEALEEFGERYYEAATTLQEDASTFSPVHALASVVE